MNSPVTASILAATGLPNGNGGKVLPLDRCDRHTRWRIVDIAAQPGFGQQDEHVSQRLKELGFLPGTPLTVIGFGLFGRSPIAVQINGTKFALRPAEAAKILVESL